VNLKAFFVDAFAAALETGVATTDDILRHATPDVLSIHLPRPLWARLIAACLGAPRVDSRLVVETIGLPNLAEHIPAQLMWAVIAEVGARALGQPVAAAQREAAPADPVARLEDDDVDAGLAQPPGRGQAGDTGPDHDHVVHGCRSLCGRILCHGRVSGRFASSGTAGSQVVPSCCSLPTEMLLWSICPGDWRGVALTTAAAVQPWPLYA